MADIDKTIESLFLLKERLKLQKDILGYGAHIDDLSSAIALLKEQEAVEPILKREGRNKYYNYYVCPRCNEEVVYDQNYCSECGAKFMWEGR